MFLKNHALMNANLVNHIEYASANASLIDEALQIARFKKGPVHINVPFDEPLYETVDALSLEIFPTEVEEKDTKIDSLQALSSIWNNAVRKMILVGTKLP